MEGSVLSMAGSRFKFNEKRCDSEKKMWVTLGSLAGDSGFVLPSQTLPHLEFAF